MSHVMLLDCTLRDGAYLIEKEFGENNIYGIINGLVKARIDCIEIGFLENGGEEKEKLYLKIQKMQNVLYQKINRVYCFAYLQITADIPWRILINIRTMALMQSGSVFFKKERYDAIKHCENIKNLGYKCFVQPVDILGYSDMELIDFIQKVNEIEPYCFSIVDTFGSMFQ